MSHTLSWTNRFFYNLIIISFSGSIFSIATSSIAIKAYNDNMKYKNMNKSNFSFIIFNLVFAIIVLILSIVGVYLKITDKTM
jgi:cell division protein FtsX